MKRSEKLGERALLWFLCLYSSFFSSFYFHYLFHLGAHVSMKPRVFSRFPSHLPPFSPSFLPTFLPSVFRTRSAAPNDNYELDYQKKEVGGIIMGLRVNAFGMRT